MGTYIYRFVTIFILFGFIFAGNEVYADGGYLDVPEIDDQFNQFDQNSISENDKKQALSKTKEEDGFWDWLTKPVSDAGNWVVDKISSAWNWSKETASNFWDAIVKILSKITEVVVDTVTFIVGITVGFLKGLGKGLIDIIVGIWNVITSPIETIKNIWHAITNPIDTITSIWSMISDSWNQKVVHGDAKSRAEWAGYAVSQLGALFFGAKGLDKASKLSKGAKAASQVKNINISKGTKATSQAKNINKAAQTSSRTFIQFKNASQAQAWIQKHYANWASTLTKSEYEAIRAYTGNNYININNVLRGFEKTFEGKNAQYVELISQALRKNPVPDNIIVYRGVSKDALGKYKNLPPHKLVGKTIEDKGFMSTSLLQSTAFNKEIIFKIKVPKGTPGAYIGDISHFPNEMEFLLDKGQKLQFTDVKSIKGKLEITCQILNY